MRTHGTLLLLSTVLAIAMMAIAAPQYARAQEIVVAPTVQDDVPWEQRTEPYRGGPLRPGSELDASLSIWVWPGAGAFVAGYAFGALFGGLNAFPEGAIPIVGPWMVVANPDPLAQALLPWMVISGIAQPAGIAVFIIGILTPSYSVIYDAPIGSPSMQSARLRILPAAPGADLGLSLAIETL